MSKYKLWSVNEKNENSETGIVLNVEGDLEDIKASLVKRGIFVEGRENDWEISYDVGVEVFILKYKGQIRGRLLNTL